MVVATAVAVPIYVGVAILLGTWIGTASSLRALRWQYDDEPPDARTVRRTLRVPVRLTVLQFALWAIATVLFTVLAAVLQPERALGVGLTVGTASIVVSGIAFLLSDFALRPLAARALVGSRADPAAQPRRGQGADRSSSGWSAPPRPSWPSWSPGWSRWSTTR